MMTSNGLLHIFWVLLLFMFMNETNMQMRYRTDIESIRSGRFKLIEILKGCILQTKRIFRSTML